MWTNLKVFFMLSARAIILKRPENRAEAGSKEQETREEQQSSRDTRRKITTT